MGVGCVHDSVEQRDIWMALGDFFYGVDCYGELRGFVQLFIIEGSVRQISVLFIVGSLCVGICLDGLPVVVGGQGNCVYIVEQVFVVGGCVIGVDLCYFICFVDVFGYGLFVYGVDWNLY